MPDAMGIHARGLTKRFASQRALDDASLDVAPGEIVCILGPNGAGKSTLIRILATIVIPDSGTAKIGGHDVVDQPDAARASLGLVLGEERSFYWRLTAHQNLEFFGVLQGMRRQDARSRADRLLEEVGLSDHRDRRFSDLSSGMRARLALARARLTEPPVLLLDEPTRSLDPEASIEFRTQLRAATQAGACALMATHDLHEASSISDRVIILRNGKVMVSLQGASATELETMLTGGGA